MKLKSKTKMTVWQFLSLGYLAVIFLGSLLLTLPFATKDGQSTSYVNALFTSTSATCVTGLVPYDTNTHWSLFGQIVIILLIQTGGLGFMTFVSVLFGMLKRNMGLYERKAFMQSAGEWKLSGIRRLIRRIFIGTGIFEGCGAILLSIRFIPDFGAAKGIYYAVWHSVSAFCNAGFDLMGGTFGGDTFVSFTRYAADPVVSLTLCGLIIIGGLGFCVWGDIVDSKGNVKKFSLYTKIIVLVNTLMLVVSTLLFFFFERNNPTYADFSTGEKWLVSFFNATTPRTAGFNTIDLNSLSDSGYLLTIMLMFIGGSSGSTAGGIKISTMAVILMGMIAVFRGRKDITIGKKRVEYSLVNQALAIFVSCLILVMTATLLICAIEPDPIASFRQVLFETVSALGTVGLSLSLTPVLSTASKLIIMLLMYAGRVGILTLALALGESRTSSEVKKPLDTLLIG
ncbi:MAG: Trk family potassium uptake protein [Clostridia bacterium]|nr:Trk family potassium uptake protein [Clostridia bacterium]